MTVGVPTKVTELPEAEAKSTPLASFRVPSANQERPAPEKVILAFNSGPDGVITVAPKLRGLRIDDRTSSWLGRETETVEEAFD